MGRHILAFQYFLTIGLLRIQLPIQFTKIFHTKMFSHLPK